MRQTRGGANHATVPMVLVVLAIIGGLFIIRSLQNERAGAMQVLTEDSETPRCSHFPEVSLDPGHEPKTTPDRWVHVDPGSFLMGSPESELGREPSETLRRVTLTRPFRIRSTEMTQGEFSSVMGFNPSHAQECGALCPVEQVTWHEAAAFTNELSRRDDLQTCYHCDTADGSWRCSESPALSSIYECTGYRLPTSAEWEFAARGGSPEATSAGALSSNGLDCEPSNQVLDEVAWFGGNSGGRAHRIALKRPTSHGLHDVLGNVWEWTHDWDSELPPGELIDPSGPSTGIQRTNRGGGWEYRARYSRFGQRSSDDPLLRCWGLGFRIVQTLNAG